MYGRLEDVPTTVTDLTNDGVCSECGACCSALLPVAESEIKTIGKYVRRHNIKPYVRSVPWSNYDFDLTCPFLDDSKPNHKCMIYEVRPFICKMFICSKTMNILDSMKIKRYHAKESVQIVNMRELFCKEGRQKK